MASSILLLCGASMGMACTSLGGGVDLGAAVAAQEAREVAGSHDPDAGVLLRAGGAAGDAEHRGDRLPGPLGRPGCVASGLGALVAAGAVQLGLDREEAARAEGEVVAAAAAAV